MTSYSNKIYRWFRALVLTALAAISGTGIINALEPSHYAPSSVLSSGRWVRVRVSGTGMYRVSASQLKSMGFKDASKVNVYGYGANIISEALTASTQPDDLPMQPVVRLSDGSIVFYGVGTVAERISARGALSHEQNPYSIASYYYLSDRETEGGEPLTVQPTGGEPSVKLDCVPVLVVHERELEAAGHTGRMLLGEDFRSAMQQTFTLEMPDRVTDTPVDLTVQMAAKTAGGTSLYSLTANGVDVGEMSIEGLRGSYSDTHSKVGTYDTEVPYDGSDKLLLQIAYNPSGCQVVYMSRLDFIRATYTRKLRLRDGELAFSFSPEGAVTELCVSGAEASTQLWDVTDAANPRRMDVAAGSDGTIRFNALQGPHKYIAFTPAMVKEEVTGAVQVRNQDLHALAVPDMVIIAPEQFATQAERLAQKHREDDGMDVVVLKPESIYNEFSSGSPDVSAFRKLLKMWYDRDPEKIGYCLLMGRATYDNRQLTNTVKNAGYPRLPIWQSENSSSETASFCTDNFIGMLDDCETFIMGAAKVRVAVGRMPVKNSGEASAAIDKLISYMDSEDLGSWRNQVMVIADDADHGDHLKQGQRVISAMEKNGNGSDFMYERLYIDSYPLGTASTSKSYPDARKRMFKIWNEGVGFIDFIGHGNPTSLTHENLLTYTDVTNMSNKRLPIMLAATCEFMRFDSDNISAAEILWLNNNGGTIAFIAANRKVYIHNNGDFNEAIGKNYFRRDKDGKARRLGDVFMGGLNDYPYSDDNRHRYALMGDPSMRIVSPEYHVAIDEIDGMSVNAGSSAKPVLTARSKVKVKGRVTDSEGNLLSDFNGRVIPTVFDAERVIETYGHNSVGEDDGNVDMYNDRKNKLFTGSFAVANGEWEATIIIPEEIDNNYSPALLNMYAYSDDLREANGSTTDFYIYGYADDSADPDNTDPEILGIGLNSYMFRDGGVVNSTPLFVAKVRDESGINISSSGIGKQMTLIVDGRRIYDDVVDHFIPDPDDYLAGEVQYTLPSLDDGDHSLLFTVWDNVGNSTTRTLDFVVKSDRQPTVNVYTDASPATAGVTFYIVPDLPLESSHCHVGVYDLSGRMVWDAPAVDSGNVAAPMSVRWDLTDRGGARVSRGIYIYRCTVSDGKGGETVVAKKIAVAAP